MINTNVGSPYIFDDYSENSSATPCFLPDSSTPERRLLRRSWRRWGLITCHPEYCNRYKKRFRWREMSLSLTFLSTLDFFYQVSRWRVARCYQHSCSGNSCDDAPLYSNRIFSFETYPLNFFIYPGSSSILAKIFQVLVKIIFLEAHLRRGFVKCDHSGILVKSPSTSSSCMFAYCIGFYRENSSFLFL